MSLPGARTQSLALMPAHSRSKNGVLNTPMSRASTSLVRAFWKDVDGRNESGHDGALREACPNHLAFARDLRDAAGRFHPHVVGFLGGVTSGRTEDHDGVAQRSASRAGDVGEDFAAQPHLAGVGDGNDVEDRSATRDVVAGFVQAVLQVGGRGGCSGLRRGGRRLRAGERILRQRRRRDRRYLLRLTGILRQSSSGKACTQSDCKNEAL